MICCPRLNELPPALDKSGWPWTVETVPFSTQQPNTKLPLISVITPSYNQGQFLEETIRSVLLQGYPNLEYIIIDGGSTDESLKVIQKYAKYLTYWISEPDRGQSHALNKGIAKVTGEIFTFINSDDLLALDALNKVSQHFIDHPTNSVFGGGLTQIDQDGKTLREMTELSPITWEDLVLGRSYRPQSGTFWRTHIFTTIGHFREDLHYFFDQEFFIRLLMNYDLETANGAFAHARFHEAAKSSQNDWSFSKEKQDVLLQFLPKVAGSWRLKFFTYRWIRLSYLIDRVAMDAQFNLLQKLMLIITTPTLWTSPTCIKRVLLSDNSHAPIKGLNAPK